MGGPIIKVEGLGKRYVLGHNKNAGGAFKYKSLGETLSSFGRGVFQRLRHPLSPNKELVDLEEFWAVKDLSFEVNPGDRVGVIGRNGAGKSTLLKLLCRITEPTTGRARIRGRVASLLEVGTGFHPELSGRENIYLNGAILGMKRAEIKSKFDEIVEFAGVEKFLDTPVKRYSSGMYVRLAFAVAAHLDPEILLIDEVLAVGDAAFQKKCLGKMEDISKNSGRTILFVSHNMGAIKRLCNKGILLKQGRLELQGDANQAIAAYLSEGVSKEALRTEWKPDPGKEISITSVETLAPDGTRRNAFDISEPVAIRIGYEAPAAVANSNFALQIFKDGTLVATSWDTDSLEGVLERRPGGKAELEAIIPPALAPGSYVVSVACGHPNVKVIDAKLECASFSKEIRETDASASGLSRGGLLLLWPKWSLR